MSEHCFVLKIPEINIQTGETVPNNPEAFFEGLFLNLQKSVETAFYGDTLDWDFIETGDEKYWFFTVNASVAFLEEADTALQSWVEATPCVDSGYIEYFLTLENRKALYNHMRHSFSQLSVGEVFALITPDAKWVYRPFAPFTNVYTYTGTVPDGWVAQHELWKPVIAMHVLADEKYDYFVDYVCSTSGDDISGLPKSWVLKSFNLDSDALIEKVSEDTFHQYAAEELKGFKNSYKPFPSKAKWGRS